MNMYSLNFVEAIQFLKGLKVYVISLTHQCICLAGNVERRIFKIGVDVMKQEQTLPGGSVIVEMNKNQS